MSRLTRDGTAEPVSRDQILRRERGKGNTIFPCSAQSRVVVLAPRARAHPPPPGVIDKHINVKCLSNVPNDAARHLGLNKPGLNNKN